MQPGACMTRPVGKTATPTWPNLHFESALWLAGKKIIAGVDEAGRGAWAGPVTAGAVILPFDQPELMNILHGVRDSKLMTAHQREHWAGVIRQIAIAFSSGWANSSSPTPAPTPAQTQTQTQTTTTSTPTTTTTTTP
ncbi:MAG: hypothetical protein WCG34_12550, partial [Leptolinea sp.]